MDLDFPLQSPNELLVETLRCLERGGVVITANARAARALMRSHAAVQRAMGKSAWKTPSIHDWESWLSIVWKQYLRNAADPELLLTSLQERSVWERIAGPDALGPLATLASTAWSLLSEYCAHDERRRSWRSATADARAFQAWAEAFERECRMHRWLARSDLSGRLTAAILTAAVEVPSDVLLVGFDRVTPAQQALFDALQNRGCDVAKIEPAAPIGPPHLVEATDLRDEITTAAWWARRQIESNPADSIAVLVHDIDSARGEIERVFRGILMPESQGIETNGKMPFEFSLGRPLSEVSVVKAALLMLLWFVKPISLSEASWLTISGFLSARDEDVNELATLDAQIRENAHFTPEIPLDVFAGYNPRGGSLTSLRFFGRLRAVRKATSEKIGQRVRTFSEWADISTSLLRQASWPGGRVLESVELQAVNRWERLINDVAGLTFEGKRVDYATFVTVLDRCAGTTIFAPESQEAPIQIMGPFESSGQNFDAVWLLGMDDSRWPPGGQPHPLLPHELQHQKGMPYSSIEIDWQLAQAATLRIVASAPECVLSYSQRDDSGDLRPSALMWEAANGVCSATTSRLFRDALHVPEQFDHSLGTEPFTEFPPPPWPVELNAGGAQILKMQSACPFQAFATQRLGARKPEDAERGLTPMERGNLLHKTLEFFWSKENSSDLQIRNYEDLEDSRVEGRLDKILEHQIERAFEERFGRRPASPWTSEYLQIERQRMKSILSEWLKLELGRVPFEVAEHEKNAEANIDGLRLKLRVDRVDLVPGGRLILDYKSGDVSPASWEGPRLDEPQVPLYAIYGEVGDLRGVLFAEIRPADMKLTGRVENATETVRSTLTSSSDLVKKPLTKEMLDGWSVALKDLANQFLAGEAEVKPKRYPQTCQFCALPALCRVAETSAASDATDDDDMSTGDNEEVQRDGTSE